MATKLKKKKIIKKIEQIVEPVVENDPIFEYDTEPEEKPYIQPESLSHSRIIAEAKRTEKINEMRHKEMKAFVAPKGFEIHGVIEHDCIPLEEESRTANRELEFWKKIKPERFYEIVRHGYYVTYLIRRPATKEEQAENVKKKKS